MSEASIQLWSGWSFPDSALADLRAHLVERLPRDQTMVVRGGWSLGGLRALQEVVEGRSPATHLILIAGTARFCADADRWPGLPEANLRALQRQFARDPREALTGFHRLCAGPDASAELIHQRTEISLSLGLETLATGLHTLATLDLRNALAQCRLPVLILHGMRDPLIPVAAAERMLEALPLAKLVRHVHAGHALPLTHPEWVAEQISAFLGTPT